MAFTTLSLGLTLKIPTAGTKNWATTVFSETWTKISRHKHTGSGDGNQLITSSYGDNSVSTLKLAKDYGFTVAPTNTPTGTTQTIDFSNGNVQPLNLGSAAGDVTLTLSNPTTGSTYRIYVTNGATPRDLVWPAAVLWPGGQKPVISGDASGKCKVELYYDGTSYWSEWDVVFA